MIPKERSPVVKQREEPKQDDVPLESEAAQVNIEVRKEQHEPEGETVQLAVSKPGEKKKDAPVAEKSGCCSIF